MKRTDPIRVARHGVARGTLFINFITNYLPMETKQKKSSGLGAYVKKFIFYWILHFLVQLMEHLIMGNVPGLGLGL